MGTYDKWIWFRRRWRRGSKRERSSFTVRILLMGESYSRAMEVTWTLTCYDILNRSRKYWFIRSGSRQNGKGQRALDWGISVDGGWIDMCWMLSLAAGRGLRLRDATDHTQADGIFHHRRKHSNKRDEGPKGYVLVPVGLCQCISGDYYDINRFIVRCISSPRIWSDWHSYRFENEVRRRLGHLSLDWME